MNNTTLTLTLEGRTYRIGALNALQQFHVLRRLAPALATMGIGIAQLKDMRTSDDFIPLLAPLSGVAAAMSDEDANYILMTCLSAVHRLEDDGRAAPMVTQSQLVYQDIDLPQMLRLTFEVLRHNLAGFMKGLGGLTT